MNILSKEEREKFINQYFKVWGEDIRKVVYNDYAGKREYLINDHYLFITKIPRTKKLKNINVLNNLY